MRRATIAVTSMALVLWLAGPPARAATCFDGQLPSAPWAETAARSAVRLVAALPDGQPFAHASGIVVADSGRPNRILTAAHVARTLQEHSGAWLAVYSSRGEYLGRAGLAARAAPGPAFGLKGGGAVGLRFGDAAVLDMIGFAPGAATAYAGIPGVPLAARQPRGLLKGEFSIPAGVDHGVSGAGVVADGRIVGIMAFKALDRSMPNIPVRGGDDGPDPAAGTLTVSLPRQAVGYAQPVIDSTILAGLGPAGRVVAGARTSATLGVFVPGFVKGACVGFRASMGPA